MKTLIIYELVPEQTIMAIVDLTNEEYELFSKAHDHYINFTEMDGDTHSAVDAINCALCKPANLERDKEDIDQLGLEYYGKWHSFITDTQNLEGVERLIHCGFIL